MITLNWYSALTAEELAAVSAKLTIEEADGRRKVSLAVDADDSSYRYRALMEKPQMVLKFSLPEYIDFPVGTWCVWQSKTYTLNSEKNLTKNGERKITYEMTLGGDEDKLGAYKMRNSVDGRLSYSMCARPHEFAEEIVKNLNAREKEDGVTWTVGECLEATEQTVEFNHAYIDEALQSVADQFETEWEITEDRAVCLHKVEYFKEDPLPLAYGRGNGFTPGLGRTTDTDEAPIKRIYTQGGEQNIDRSKYGGKNADGTWANAFHYKTSSAQLRLPISQTLEYEGRTYKTDEDGYYVERADKASDAVKEDSLDCSEIYPKYVGKVTAVEAGSEASAESSHFYDIIAKDIPDALDYGKVMIDGETPTVAFQTGMLAGKEFEFTYKHSERRFKLVPQEIDGITMPDPDSGYFPKEGDEFIVLGVMLPDAYVCDDDTQSGAAWDMFREAARKLYENEEQKFTFKGELQGLWCKRNWLRIGGRLKVGGYIHFTDSQFAKDGVDMRITGIKDYLYSPYSPTVEIGNSVSGKSVTSSLREIERAEVVIKDTKTELAQYTKRRFRDAKETVTMLEEAMLGDYTATVSPVAVLTMAMLVGDESLQFEWVESKDDPASTAKRPSYNAEHQRMEIPAMGLKHLTLGITDISSTHTEYKVWQMQEWQSPTLTEAAKKYYLYALVSHDTDEKGEYFLSEKAVGMNDRTGSYVLLVGILNSESGGERSFVEMHGYTEVLPGRITTERIVSEDGKNWLDLKNNQFVLGNMFSFDGNATDNKLVVKGRVEATEGYFHNGKFTNADVTGKITSAEGRIGGFAINTQSIGNTNVGQGYSGAAQMELENAAVSFAKGETKGGVTESKYARYGVAGAAEASSGLDAMMCLRDYTPDSTSGAFSYIAGMVLDMDGQYGRLLNTNNEAIRITRGCISGFRLATDTYPYKGNNISSNVAIITAGGDYYLPDWSADGRHAADDYRYNGHFIMVSILTSEAVRIHAQGGNCIFAARAQAMDTWSISENSHGLAATFVFCAHLNSGNYNGAWVEFKHPKAFE